VRFLLTVLVFVAGLAVTSTGRAQDFVFDGAPIVGIEIVGNQRIEAETIRSYMQIGANDRFEPAAIDRAFKALYSTGLFADVVFERRGNVLVVNIVENPVINRLVFEGNDEIEDEVLQQEIQLRPRVVYTQARVQSDTQRIIDIYQRSGLYNVQVEPKIIQLDQNRVDLVFEITEGEETLVERIDFVGNEAFSDGSLRGEILTREASFWNFLSDADIYDPDRISVDEESLRRFYNEEGYADFRVVSSVVELSPDESAFFLTFTVEEGIRYQIGEITIVSTLRDLDPEELYPLITFDEGDWYDISEIDKTVEALVEAIGTLGYAFVDVRPRYDRNPEEGIMAVTFEIQEGPRVFIDRIDIVGNLRTLDKVIRREFRLAEGDPFNAQKLARTQQRIQNLGFFSYVNIEPQPTADADKVRIRVEVEEQSTGELTFGLGFSTADGPLGQIGLRERNLLGHGNDLRLDLSLSGRQSLINLSFTDPYFRDKPLAVGFDIYHTEIDREESSFHQRQTGFALRAGYELTEYTRQNWRYNFAYEDIYDLSDNVSLAIAAQAGTSYTSSITHTIIYDRRDNRFLPHDGHFVSLSNEGAGLGGSVRFFSTEVAGGYYIPVSDTVTLEFAGEVGAIHGIGQGVDVANAFFVGGDDLRGFADGGIGPQDVVANDQLGGNKYFVGSVQLSFPLGLPEEYGLGGRVFTDFGTLFDTDASCGANPPATCDIADSKSLRASIGFGLTWNSFLGPIAVDLAYPVMKESYDKTEFFRFSVGTRF
jgi:outer membrane protein insertion porin family